MLRWHHLHPPREMRTVSFSLSPSNSFVLLYVAHQTATPAVATPAGIQMERITFKKTLPGRMKEKRHIDNECEISRNFNKTANLKLVFTVSNVLNMNAHELLHCTVDFSYFFLFSCSITENGGNNLFQ